MSSNHYPAPGEIPPPHPFSALFPLLGTQELQELANDIKKHGQHEKIVLHEGQILDGRNRANACLAAGIEPEWRFYDPQKDGKSPLAYVMGKNLKRRHLTPSQAAAVAAEALPLFEQEAAARRKVTQFSREPSGKPGNGVVITGQTNVQVQEIDLQGPTEEGALTPAQIAEMVGEARLQLPEMCEILRRGRTPNGAKFSKEYGESLKEKIAAAEALIAQYPEEPAPGTNGTTVVVDEFDQRTAGSEGLGHEQPPEGTKKGSKPKRTVVPKGTTAPATGKAAEAAAEVTNVSTRSVETAKHLKETAPKKFEEVKTGAKSLHKAAREAEMETDEVAEAMLKIRRVCGQSFHDAVKDQTRLKGAKEVLAYAALEDEKMLAIRHLIADGYKVKEAVKYKMATLCRTHKIGDLIQRAVAQGGTFTLDIEGFLISVHRKSEEMPATTAADTARTKKK